MCKLTPNCPNPDYAGLKGCAECLQKAAAETDRLYAEAEREAERMGPDPRSQEEIDAELEMSREFFDLFIAGDR